MRSHEDCLPLNEWRKNIEEYSCTFSFEQAAFLLGDRSNLLTKRPNSEKSGQFAEFGLVICV